MRAAVIEISSKSVRKSSFRISTKNAWAKYVRARWKINTLAEVQREWGLSEGRARGVIYAQITQATIDEILDSMPPVKAFALSLEITALRLNTSLEDYITHQAEEARRERARWEQEERNLALLASRLPGRSGQAGRGDKRARSDRAENAALGADGNAPPVRLIATGSGGEP
jgi:hypothetical protein